MDFYLGSRGSEKCSSLMQENNSAQDPDVGSYNSPNKKGSGFIAENSEIWVKFKAAYPAKKCVVGDDDSDQPRQNFVEDDQGYSRETMAI